MGGCLDKQHDWERAREQESESENPDSDRDGPGLSLGLLSGRVCASLSACLSSALLSILLKTICLLIIHPLLFWTDMFSLHQYFHHSANGRFSALPRAGGQQSARWCTLRRSNISKETFFIPYDAVIRSQRRKQMTTVHFIRAAEKIRWYSKGLYLLGWAALFISQVLSRPSLISFKSWHYQKPRLKERANLIMILAVLSCRPVDEAASQNKIKKKGY